MRPAQDAALVVGQQLVGRAEGAGGVGVAGGGAVAAPSKPTVVPPHPTRVMLGYWSAALTVRVRPLAASA